MATAEVFNHILRKGLPSIVPDMGSFFPICGTPAPFLKATAVRLLALRQ